jgi:hypothetical protein
MYLGSSRILTGIAALVLAGPAVAGAVVAGAVVVGTAVVAVPAAHAATTACGSGCVALVSEEWGAGYVTSVAGLDTRDRYVTLAAAGQSASEDFQRDYVATVATLYADGIVGSAVGETWPSDDAYEYEYTPDGTSTSLCLGTATTATDGTGVRLETCGVDAETLWIAMSGDAQSGYEPLINGTDTNASTPYVLTSGAIGNGLTTQELFEVNHSLSSTQLWQNKFGVL